ARVDRRDFAREDDVELPVRRRFAQTFLVARAHAEEAGLAVGERDLVARLLGETERRFDRAVAAADDEELAALVRVRVEQAVRDLRQVFAGHFETPRRAAPAEREAHAARAIRADARRHGEDAVCRALDALEHGAALDRELALGGDALPELDELLFRVRRAV